MSRQPCVAVLLLLAASSAVSPQASNPARIEAGGIVVPAPSGWTADTGLVAEGGPIAFTNFGGAWLRGGLVPPGGAEIEITSVPAPPVLMEYIRAELAGSPLDSPQEFAEGPNSGIRVAYTESLAAGASLRTIVSYIPRGPALYKFYLTYWSGDPAASAFQSALSAVLREAQLR